MAEMTVREMVAERLRADGYDGLAGDECACHLSDLMWCDTPEPDKCVAAHEVPYKEDGDVRSKMVPGPEKGEG